MSSSYYIIFNDTYQYLFTQLEFDRKFGSHKHRFLLDFMIIEILPEIVIKSDLDLIPAIEETYLR
jgi:hypothetical protein